MYDTEAWAQEIIFVLGDVKTMCNLLCSTGLINCRYVFTNEFPEKLPEVCFYWHLLQCFFCRAKTFDEINKSPPIRPSLFPKDR